MTQLICGILNFFTDLIVNKFPSFIVSSYHLEVISLSFNSVLEFIAQVNFFVPLSTILLILSLVYGIKLAKFALFLANWLIRRIADIIP